MTGADEYEDDVALAAEYVLHLLDPDDRAEVEKRLLRDNTFQRLVYDWEARLAPLADDVDAVAPSEALRGRVLDQVAPDAPPSPFQAGWRGLLAGAVAAGLLAFAVYTYVAPPTLDMTPAFEARFVSEDETLVLAAVVIPATHEIVFDRITGAPRDGRVHEVWLIAEGADAPVSLGLLADSGTTRIRVADEIAPGVRTGTIAISDEPLGGSPTGAPTGDILATGTFTDI